MGLTKRDIDRFIYSGVNQKQDIRWDDEIPGFGIRIYPSEKKSFVLSYRALGRKHIMVLGSYGVLTLEQARKEARITLGKVANGQNPIVEKKSFANLKTIGELCEIYLEKHSKIHKKSWKEDVRRITTHILPELKNTPVASVTIADVSQLHHNIGKNSIYEANRTIELLRGVIEKGKMWGFAELNSYNPVKGVKRFKEKKRDRWITHEELPRVTAAIAEEPNLYVRAAIWLYLFTGVRKSELLNAQWTDVDLQRGELRLRDTKAGNDHYVPLSSAAVSLLMKLPRQADNPFIICGSVPGKPLVNISKPWDRIRRKAGVEDVRLHDLRRTVGSWLAQNGMSLHLIGRVLNHASSDTTKIYARFGQDTVRDALESHGLNLLTSSQPKELTLR